MIIGDFKAKDMNFPVRMETIALFRFVELKF